MILLNCHLNQATPNDRFIVEIAIAKEDNLAAQEGRSTTTEADSSYNYKVESQSKKSFKRWLFVFSGSCNFIIFQVGLK